MRNASSLVGTLAVAGLLVLYSGPAPSAFAQDNPPAPAAASSDDQASDDPLTEEELEVLVARIALYPDELVALISAASLYPLQIVEAQRFLEQHKKDSKLKPKSSWDGSIISLLNYPDVVKMMSDDLDWTQSLGDALANQQKDVLMAIQQLRDQAVAAGVIKTDDKVKVTNEGDNIIIQPANPEKIYIPQYPPEMLYQEGYAMAPVSYYPQSYEPYYWPNAGFWAGAATGVFWGAAINWGRWGIWGGNFNGDLDIDCNNCFNNRNFNGKLDLKNVDWNNIDRSKLNIDRNQFAKLDRTNIGNRLEASNRNNLQNRAGDLRANGDRARPGGGAGGIGDVRKSTLEGLKQGQGNRPGQGVAGNRPGQGVAGNRPGQGVAGNRPGQGGAGDRPGQGARPGGGKGQGATRPAGKPKPGGKIDNRPQKPSGLGEVRPGRSAKQQSQRGARSMGGGMSGGPPRAMNYGGGRPSSMHRGYGGGGRNFSGGGGGGRQFRGGGGGRGGGGRRR